MASRKFFVGLIILQAFVLGLSSTAFAACGAAYQRMEIGFPPDLFLNHLIELEPPQPNRGGGSVIIPNEIINSPITERMVRRGVRIMSRTDNAFYYWTANTEAPPKGDCNVIGRVSIPDVGLYVNYGGCDFSADLCDINWSPHPSTVGPAIDDFAVKQWELKLIARERARNESRGGLELFIIDAQGDIFSPPPCLEPTPVEEQSPESEFYEPSVFVPYDPDDPCWRGEGPAGSPAYLIGRGNVYVGPLVQPMFEVTAETATRAVPIRHWIANENAVILVTPQAPQTGGVKYFAVQYDATLRQWNIVAEGGDVIIPAGSKFNVYVMGNAGPGFRLNSFDSGTEIPVEHPLLDNNPNAVIFATHVVTERCVERVAEHELEEIFRVIINPNRRNETQWVCAMDYFPHPIGVRYNTASGRWFIVSEDGTPFADGGSVFNIVVTGLAGSYRQANWLPGQTPEYAGGLETAFGSTDAASMALPQLNNEASNRPLFITHNQSPYNEDGTIASRVHANPTGVALVDGRWRIVNLNDNAMSTTAFNVIAPLPAR